MFVLLGILLEFSEQRLCKRNLPVDMKNIAQKKLSFPLQISSVNVTKSNVSADLVTFTEEIHNEKLYYLRSEI